MNASDSPLGKETPHAAPRLAAALLVLLAASSAYADPPAGQETPAQDSSTAAPVVQAIAEEDEKPRSGWAALPVLTYSPDTRLGAGLFATHFFRAGDASAETRPSSLSAVGLYTMRGQLITELIPELYWDNQRWHVWSRLDYRLYPNALWAIGNGASEASKERYVEDRWRWQAKLDHTIGGAIRVVAKLEALHMDLEEVEPGGLIARGEVPGSEGGRSIGIGPGALWDTRDHLLTPRRGELCEVSFMGWGEPLGSEYQFGELRVDLRKYIGLGDQHVIALWLFSLTQVGDVPFYKLAQLGGQDMLRGYYEGRFRDKALVALQAEYRFPMFWRFSGVVHGGLGQVARQPSLVTAKMPEWSFGPGLRLMLNTDERLNLRADLGLGREDFGFYVGIGEAF